MSRIGTLFVMFFLDLAPELVDDKGDGENLPVPFAITAIYSNERISDDTFQNILDRYVKDSNGHAKGEIASFYAVKMCGTISN